MDPMIIVLICGAAFGVVMVIAAFVRQLLLSRDKKINDEAQSKALAQEAAELEKIRVQMQSNTRFEAHYQMLGENKVAIKYLDTQIDELLHKKTEIIDRYAQITIKESGSIINTGEVSTERKAACDKLREEIDLQIASYNKELEQLQTRRALLWNTHGDFQKYLLAQEKTRNNNLDNVYKQHSALLEKVYLRHIENSEAVALKNIEAGNLTFKDIIMAPIQFLTQYFTGVVAVPTITLVQTKVEQAARMDVANTEHDINDSKSEDINLSDEHQDVAKEDEEELKKNAQPVAF